MEVTEVPQEWIEVNIAPLSAEQPERLLLDLIDPLVHDRFRGRVGVWFFGWYSEPQEYHLRLRIRWQRSEQADDDRAELFGLLNAARDEGQLARWWPGNHGREGEIYQGEAAEYGELWELSCQDWNSGSELALALVKLDPDRRLAERRRAQWSSRAHLHANRLGWGYYYEALFCLVQARGNLGNAGTADRRLANFVGPIEQAIGQQIEQLAAGPP